ncbi:MAG TPA: hypothetical protein VE172_08580 [Stackebrandtia sp.]|jgi:hypothetical protein|uniref:hypothetical protein n=1 Tax=Stackebrandtia sp. TaxID=2023065 RepID=UPI002D515388|nr:hypothetical protein [Stackebrandtia sp.]HZE38856.1 hypothetical protein [Stackebrandtia sp.]
METYAQLMERLDLRVSSPDKRIKARIKGRNAFDIKFLGNAYREYTTSAMEGQFEGLCQLVWVGYRKAALTARSRTPGAFRSDQDEEPLSTAEEELFAKRKQLEFEAMSSRGSITLACRGWRRWKVTIAPRTLDTLSEEKFLSEARSVVPRILNAYHDRYDRLLDDFHKKRDPESYRDRKRYSRPMRRQMWTAPVT